MEISQERRRFVKKWNASFRTDGMPTEEALLSFLRNNGLACLLEAGHEPASILVTNPTKIMLCLSPSAALSETLIKKLSAFLRRSTNPIELYWPYQGQDGHYHALCLQAIRTEKTIICSPNLLHPTGMPISNYFIGEIFEKLKQQLSEFTVTLCVSEQEFSLAGTTKGTDSYWVLLSLLYALTQESELHWQQCHQWLQEYSKPFRVWNYLDPILSTLPILNPILFNLENVLTMLNMPLIRQNIIESLIDENGEITLNISRGAQRLLRLEALMLHLGTLNGKLTLNNKGIQRLLRLGALGMLFYQKDDVNLKCIPLLFFLQFLSQYSFSFVQNGWGRLCLNYIFHLFNTGIVSGFKLYMTFPKDAIEANIITTRYVLHWSQNLLQGGVKFLIQMPSIFICILLMQGLLGFISADINNIENQAGLLAIAILGMQYWLPLIDRFLPQFKNWTKNQAAEEAVLSWLANSCKKPCEFKITSPTIERCMQQALSNSQQLSLQATTALASNQSAIDDCEVKIQRGSRCTDYVLSCHQSVYQSSLGTSEVGVREIPSQQRYSWEHCPPESNRQDLSL